MRDGELVAGVVTGWNFGDGHLHDQQLLERYRSAAPSATVNSQSSRSRGSRRTCDPSATGSRCGERAIEEGWVRVAEIVARRPWLARASTFPVQVTARRAAALGGGPSPRERGDRRRLRPERAGVRGRARPDRYEASPSSRPQPTSAAARGRGAHRARRAARRVLGRPPDGGRLAVCASLDLARARPRVGWPEVDCAHPLDDGAAGVMLRSIDADGGGRRRRAAPGGALFERPWPASTGSPRNPRPGPARPATPAAPGALRTPAAAAGDVVARSFWTPLARALFAGVAAHAMAR